MKTVKHIGPWAGAKPRVYPPSGIIVHAMSQQLADGDKLLHAPDWLSAFKLSVHAFIDVDGTIIEGVSPAMTAWHAGQSRFGSQTNLNAHYLGVELLVPGVKSYSEFLAAINKQGAYSSVQYKALAYWCVKMERQYPTIATIVGHSTVSGDDVRGAGKGKRDPGAGFDWDVFAAERKAMLKE